MKAMHNYVYKTKPKKAKTISERKKEKRKKEKKITAITFVVHTLPLKQMSTKII